MVRISDARMSGTAYGTVVLHTAPEAAAGGPLALVQNGDIDRARRRQARSSTCTCPTSELARAQDARGSRCRRTPTAAGSSSTATRCCRRTRASTSTSSSASPASKVGQGQPLTVRAAGQAFSLGARGRRKCRRSDGRRRLPTASVAGRRSACYRAMTLSWRALGPAVVAARPDPGGAMALVQHLHSRRCCAVAVRAWRAFPWRRRGRSGAGAALGRQPVGCDVESGGARWLGTGANAGASRLGHDLRRARPAAHGVSLGDARS